MMLYRLLTGRVPFDDQSIANALLKRVKDPAPPIRQYNPDLTLNDTAEKILLSMLEKDPEDRPDSAMAVIAALDKELGLEKKY